MAGDENKTDPVTLCGDSGAGNQPCGSFKCLNMGLQRWIGFMVLVEMVWQVSATGTGPISREWGEEANLAGRNARAPRQVTENPTPQCAVNLAPDEMRWTEVTASKGGSAQLSCKMPKEDGAADKFVVLWTKGKDTIAVFTDRNGAQYPGSPGRRKFMKTNVVETRDASLVLTGLEEEDAGKYSCAWLVNNVPCKLNTKLAVQ
ncbi:uncharacterized protein LOC129708945 [Leucoraja erinacea]|uniref:uncharacterized protein LOC129708945 n=1 Tax=Leucoraja erinaceus TaxID=7782 RepID=UPI0024560348|nr:uncharacterized protein LOC129708945 [Leucoraja erinacea]